MPRYFYTAKTFQGETRTGTLEVKDTHQLARVLREQGLILIKAKQEEKLEKGRFGISFSFRGPSLSEKMFFTKNLQVMISAGLPLPRALETLSTQTKSKKFKKAILDIKEEIIKGKSFSAALAKHPNIFSELFQNMVKVGEEGGKLEEVLKTLTLQMERENNLKQRVTGALLYPAVIICAMIGIGILMLVMVVPQLAETFKELETELPLTTRIVIGLGDFLVKKWYFVILILISLFFLFWQTARTKKGKKIIDKLFLKTPIISQIIKKTNSAYTVRNLSSLIAAGVPIVRSLEITSTTLGNIYYKAAIVKAIEIVRKGGKLSEALEPYQSIYSPIVIQMIAVGEETGETSDILAKLADFFEEEVATSTKNLASVIEPVLMLLIGGAVGFFAISMVQPMYSMLGAIK